MERRSEGKWADYPRVFETPISNFTNAKKPEMPCGGEKPTASMEHLCTGGYRLDAVRPFPL